MTASPHDDVEGLALAAFLLAWAPLARRSQDGPRAMREVKDTIDWALLALEQDQAVCADPATHTIARQRLESLLRMLQSPSPSEPGAPQ